MKTTRGALAVMAGLGLWLAGGTAGAVDSCALRCEKDEVVFVDACKKTAKSAAGGVRCRKIFADVKKTCLEQCADEARPQPASTTKAPEPGSEGAK